MEITLFIALDDGWRTMTARFELNSPIALLTMMDRQERRYLARLDLDKRMLIDPVPTSVSPGQLATIAAEISRRRSESRLESERRL